jgi:DNA-binding MarR family transcriptional regulator
LLRIVAEAEEAGEPLTVSGLAERLGRSDSTVVQVLGKMEAKGLIERQRDGRNTFVGVGLMGQAMVAPRKPELVRELPPDSRVLAEVSSPKRWLCA